MRLLQGLGKHFNIVERKILSPIVQTLIAPRLQHDIDGLVEARMSLIRRDPEGLELLRVEAATRAPIDAATGENIEERDFLGQSQRMVQCRERHRGADTQLLGARGRIRAHHRNRRAHAVVVEMMLSEPDRIVARVIHDLDALERAIVNRRQRHPAIGPTEELQYSEFHLRLTYESTVGLEDRGVPNPKRPAMQVPWSATTSVMRRGRWSVLHRMQNQAELRRAPAWLLVFGSTASHRGLMGCSHRGLIYARKSF